MQKRYDRTIDKALLRRHVVRALRLPEAERPELVAALLGKAKPSDEAIDKAIDALYDKTSLEDAKRRVELVKTATTAEIKKSKDPWVQLALKLGPRPRRWRSARRRSRGRCCRFARATSRRCASSSARPSRPTPTARCE